MKPNPFLSLNHFTVPLTTVMTSFKNFCNGPKSQVTTLVKDLSSGVKPTCEYNWALVSRNLLFLDNFVKC